MRHPGGCLIPAAWYTFSADAYGGDANEAVGRGKELLGV